LKLVFINKSHDEKRDESKEFAIVNILKSMTESVALENNNEVMLLISPGYLSTTSASSQELYKNIFDKKINYRIGMLNGYRSAPECLGYLNKFLGDNNLPDPIRFSPQGYNRVTGDDHRKMIFICAPDCVDTCCRCCLNNCLYCLNNCLCCVFSGKKQLEFEDIDRFVDDINICGILIGSSNFSHSTYMGGKCGRASKGEADVLMYRDPFYCEINEKFDLLLEKNIRVYDIKQKFPEEHTPEIKLPKDPEGGEGYEKINRMIRNSLGSILTSEVKGGLGKKTDLDFFRDILRDTLKSQVK
jgi:hypothetical protein